MIRASTACVPERTMEFSANLGMLWADRPLAEAIHAAKAAGFAAVECHWPYDQDRNAVAAALAETGLPMLGLNTRKGDSFGLNALPGREPEARAAIDEAIAYADAVDARAIHVMAGIAEGQAARATFLANLRYAAGRTSRLLLIEPINAFDVPGYFLNTSAQAAEIIHESALGNLKLMFDCYHVGRTEGDVVATLADMAPLIGHIQIAAVPDRGPPDHGVVDYSAVFGAISALGWTRPIGAEYRPDGATEASLDWLEAARSDAGHLLGGAVNPPAELS